MEILSVLIIIIYGAALLFIFGFSISQLNLLIVYLKNKAREKREKNIQQHADYPFPGVTIQLPVYNELYVAERLIDAVAQLDYPKELLEIQVLDDSTDETTDVISRKVKSVREKGLTIHHIRRDSREGFKAGALAHGLQFAKNEFIAIFDSDFLPLPDFLKRTMAVFEDKKIGVVQARWDHLNKDYSLLTRLQAFGLDAHFTIEQKGRNAAGHFINFNGTAGVWRTACIIDSGGWQSDTLTEDLDLSYRAQLKGWKFIYLEDVNVPAELPVTMSALKNQQYRWNKGAAECAKKNLLKVLQEKNIRLSTKLHAVFHLMNSTVFVAVVISGLLSIPMLLIKAEYRQFHWMFFFASFFLVGFLVLSVFYYTAHAQKKENFFRNIFQFIKTFPVFLSVSMGLALHNAVAVLEGYFGRKTSFMRTPKFNIRSSEQSWKGNRYLESRVSWITVVEALLALYFTGGLLLAFVTGDFGLFPFHLMLALGYAIVFYYSVSHSRRTAVTNE